MLCLAVKKKDDPIKIFFNLLISVRVHEFAYQWYERSTAFTLNQTNITSRSEVFALRHETRIIVSRAAALMNGEEASGSRAQHTETAARRNDVTLVHIYIKKLFKKQWRFVNSS